MDSNFKKQLMLKIKQKKEFLGLSDGIVEEQISSFIKKYKLNLEALSPKQLNLVVKEIRANLRNLTGRFQRSSKNRPKLLEQNSMEKLLSSHSSTAERIDFYPKLKELLAELKVRSVLDLGCGLNPIALADKKIKYFASDIKEDELSLIDSFFKKNKISGKTFVCDLRKINENFQELPKADICIIFKVLDIIDDKKHKLSREIIQKVPCNKLLVSFSTKKLSGKPMNFPERRWFDNSLKVLGYKYSKFSSDNEVFYLIEKT